MARKVKIKRAEVKVESEFKDGVPVHVVRVPRTNQDGAWEKSPRGSLLMDTLCFPVGSSVSISKRSKTDPAAWRVKIDDAEFTVAEAAGLSIGMGSLKDTTTGVEYMVKDTTGKVVMGENTKATIIARCKRRTCIKRSEIICTITQSLAKIQGLSSLFTQEEKAAIFSPLATLVNSYQTELFREAPKERGSKSKPSFIALKA